MLVLVLLLVATAGEYTFGEVCHPLDAVNGNVSGDTVHVLLLMMSICEGVFDEGRFFLGPVAAETSGSWVVLWSCELMVPLDMTAFVYEAGLNKDRHPLRLLSVGGSGT